MPIVHWMEAPETTGSAIYIPPFSAGIRPRGGLLLVWQLEGRLRQRLGVHRLEPLPLPCPAAHNPAGIVPVEGQPQQVGSVLLNHAENNAWKPGNGCQIPCSACLPEETACRKFLLLFSTLHRPLCRGLRVRRKTRSMLRWCGLNRVRRPRRGLKERIMQAFSPSQTASSSVRPSRPAPQLRVFPGALFGAVRDHGKLQRRIHRLELLIPDADGARHIAGKRNAE